MIKYDQIKKFRNWKKLFQNQHELSYLDYISMNIHPDDILIVYKLFFPEFIEKDGIVFFKEHFNDKNYNDLRKEYDQNYIEYLINHIHIYDLFAHNKEIIEDEVFLAIGDILKIIWQSHLKQLYPDKTINVELNNSEDEYGPVLNIKTMQDA